MKKAKPHKTGYLWGGASTATKRKPDSKPMSKQNLIDAIRKRKAKSI